jgi:hypothetical protein
MSGAQFGISAAKIKNRVKYFGLNLQPDAGACCQLPGLTLYRILAVEIQKPREIAA